MIYRERMQQYDGRAIAEKPICNFGVAAFDALRNASHAGD
jgi:hypothetical protein